MTDRLSNGGSVETSVLPREQGLVCLLNNLLVCRSVSWHMLLDELEDLPEGATLITPLSHQRSRIIDVQEHRIVIQFENDDEKRPLQRDQFESLYRRIQDALDGFDLDRLPPDADAYPAVLSVHPRIEVDEEVGVITETEDAATTQLVGSEHEPSDEERTEPDGLDVHSDALLLIDALERHNVAVLPELDTDTLIDIYTLLSDVQRDANNCHQEVADVLLGRLYHDRPVSGQYGSVQRTSRRNRSLKADEDVLSRLEDAGIERVMSVDRRRSRKRLR